MDVNESDKSDARETKKRGYDSPQNVSDEPTSKVPLADQIVAWKEPTDEDLKVDDVEVFRVDLQYSKPKDPRDRVLKLLSVQFAYGTHFDTKRASVVMDGLDIKALKKSAKTADGRDFFPIELHLMNQLDEMTGRSSQVILDMESVGKKIIHGLSTTHGKRINAISGQRINTGLIVTSLLTSSAPVPLQYREILRDVLAGVTKVRPLGFSMQFVKVFDDNKDKPLAWVQLEDSDGNVFHPSWNQLKFGDAKEAPGFLRVDVGTRDNPREVKTKIVNGRVRASGLSIMSLRDGAIVCMMDWKIYELKLKSTEKIGGN